MTKSEEETLALLGALRAACEELASKWEHEYWESSDTGSREKCAKQLRALLAQTPLPVADADAEAATKEKVGMIDICVMIGVLCKDVVDLSKRIEKLEKATLAPQEER